MHPFGVHRRDVRRRVVSKLLLWVLLVFRARPLLATTYAPDLFPQTGRERFEEYVNEADFVCEASLVSLVGDADKRAVLERAVMLKGDPLPPRFEVRTTDIAGTPQFEDARPGTRYRLFLVRPGFAAGKGHEAPGPAGWFVATLLRTIPVAQEFWAYPQSTIDTILARSRFDTLCTQAELVVLAHADGWQSCDRDGRSVMSTRLRVDRVLKGAGAGPVILYQAPHGPPWTGSVLIYLRRHGPCAWETVWPGAGAFGFDQRNRETRTGEPLQSHLERLEHAMSRSSGR